MLVIVPGNRAILVPAVALRIPVVALRIPVPSRMSGTRLQLSQPGRGYIVRPSSCTVGDREP